MLNRKYNEKEYKNIINLFYSKEKNENNSEIAKQIISNGFTDDDIIAFYYIIINREILIIKHNFKFFNVLVKGVRQRFINKYNNVLNRDEYYYKYFNLIDNMDCYEACRTWKIFEDFPL